MKTWMAVGVAAAVTACASTRSGNTMGTGGTSAGDIGMSTDADGGMWMDNNGGMWMDTSGVMRMGGRTGMVMGMQPADVSAMSNQNILAHLATGDSLEINLSRLGTDQAMSSAVRDFTQRMVNEHTAHLQRGARVASQNGIAPIPAMGDTMDVMMANRMQTRVGATTGNPARDRQLMNAEVMMHRHMLNELTMLRPQASGAVQQLIDETIPVVRAHLRDAQAIQKEIGGRRNARR